MKDLIIFSHEQAVSDFPVPYAKSGIAARRVTDVPERAAGLTLPTNLSLTDKKLKAM
jgi:hypothetical protein